jgi:hypothetical protein
MRSRRQMSASFNVAHMGVETVQKFERAFMLGPSGIACARQSHQVPRGNAQIIERRVDIALHERPHGPIDRGLDGIGCGVLVDHRRLGAAGFAINVTDQQSLAGIAAI